RLPREGWGVLRRWRGAAGRRRPDPSATPADLRGDTHVRSLLTVLEHLTTPRWLPKAVGSIERCCTILRPRRGLRASAATLASSSSWRRERDSDSERSRGETEGLRLDEVPP